MENDTYMGIPLGRQKHVLTKAMLALDGVSLFNVQCRVSSKCGR